MKLLFIHSDYLEYRVTEAVKGIAEPIDEEGKSGRMEETLVVFIAVEKGDRQNLDELVTRVDAEVKKTAGILKVKGIVLYPYAHLSSNLAPPGEAVAVIKAMEKGLKEAGLSVLRSPFGWYKAFKLSCKGHPMSELSREIHPEEEKEVVSDAVEAEERAKSDWFVLDEEGELHSIKLDSGRVGGFDFTSYQGLESFARHEMAKSRVTKRKPPHVELMQRQELVDYEPASDPGNLRYYPKGKLVKSLIESYVSEKVRETGGMEVETPIMYDYEHPSLKEYLHRFPARQYAIQTPNKKVFLRFAACFGQFLMMHDATVSYRALPLRLYELTRYSFRVEQRGELAGLRRLRTFTMPDCHSFCSDIGMAKRELLDRFRLSKDIMSGIEFELPRDLEFAIRATRDFYEEQKDFLVELVKEWGKPALVEMWDERFFYFIFKYEWNFVDALGKASALNTDQIDVENAERYGITYTDSRGEKHHPLILHQSPSGAIERIIYALLERIYMRQQKGEKPEFPLWLAPTQVRFLPINESHNEVCIEMAKKIHARADVDDRDGKIGKKIRDAEREWVNLIVVYGEKEAKSGKLPVRFRTGEIKEMTLEEVEELVKKEIEGFPYLGLPLNVLLSKRVKFRG
ncbi:MAG: threonine--tRNA ligase [Thermoplasmata archaeon]|nr:threonine--tRNA ligase [Thermoplasmata archaeon]